MCSLLAPFDQRLTVWVITVTDTSVETDQTKTRILPVVAYLSRMRKSDVNRLTLADANF
jgi:hypothetical protein